MACFLAALPITSYNGRPSRFSVTSRHMQSPKSLGSWKQDQYKQLHITWTAHLRTEKPCTRMHALHRPS